jgi:hypothetical protein
VAQVLVGGTRVGQRDLEVGADDGKRVAQLVGGLVDELALGLERVVDAPEHVVERVRQLAQLVGRSPEVDAPRQVRGLDLLRDARDPLDRAQHDAREHPTDQQADDEQDQQRGQLEVPQHGEGLLVDELLEHARSLRTAIWPLTTWPSGSTALAG